MLTWQRRCAVCVCAAAAVLAYLAFTSLGHMHQSFALSHTVLSCACSFYIQELQSVLGSSWACMYDKTCHDTM